MAYIHWNANGTIIDFYFFTLRWYSLLFASGFFLGYILLLEKFKTEGVAEQMLEKLAIYVIVATVIGARLGHCLFYDFDYYSQNIAEIFLPVRFHPEVAFIGYQGLASHGGAIAILMAIFFYSHRNKIEILWVLDKLALVAPLVGCFIRLGNLMNSEIFGKPTHVAWAFVFEQVDPLPRHPTQLYEAFAYFIIFLFINKKAQKINQRPGYIFGLFLILLFMARFLLEFFKADQSAFESGMVFNMGQLLSIPFIMLGIILLYLSNSKRLYLI
jgi:prolipoprotein diacylglyceryl transferase